MFENHPRIKKQIALGNIFIEKNHYIGKAADGVEVELGEVGYEWDLENYLITFSGPDKW